MHKFYHRRLSFFNKINLTIYLRFLRFYNGEVHNRSEATHNYSLFIKTKAPSEGAFVYLLVAISARPSQNFS